MAEVFSKEILDRARKCLEQSSGCTFKHFFVRVTRQGAAEIAADFGVELKLDKKGEQLIGQYLIQTK